MAANTATPFLWGAGTANNGLLQTATTLMGASDSAAGGLNYSVGLANAGTTVSAAYGATGVFKNSDTGQATQGDVYLTLGAIASALVAGAVLSGWFLTSPDGGTTFEHTVSGAAMARAPDFVIPLPATTISAGWTFKSGGAHKVIVPAFPFKVFIQNNSGQTFATSGNSLILATCALDY